MMLKLLSKKQIQNLSKPLVQLMSNLMAQIMAQKVNLNQPIKSVVYGEFRQIFKIFHLKEQNEVEELRKLTNAQNAIQYYISCEKNYETAKSVILQLN